jgi:hypothetical protein
VARRQLLLDLVLARQQPVHRRVQIVLVGSGHAEVRGQRRGVPPARRGQLRMRRHDACSYHRQHPVALGRSLGGDQLSQAQAPHGSGHRLHMAMRARGGDLEGLRQRHEGFALQRAANDLDQRLGQVRQVAQRLVLDLAVFAIAAPQQVRAIHLVLVFARRRDDVRCSRACRHAHQHSRCTAESKTI